MCRWRTYFDASQCIDEYWLLLCVHSTKTQLSPSEIVNRGGEYDFDATNRASLRRRSKSVDISVRSQNQTVFVAATDFLDFHMRQKCEYFRRNIVHGTDIRQSNR